MPIAAISPRKSSGCGPTSCSITRSCANPESAGRKLEFVVQEIGREINTVGSKANDVEISRNVVEIKGVLERIRELVQNVE